MLLLPLSDHFRIVPGRMFPRYRTYIDTLHNFFIRHYDRFRLQYGHENKAVAMLRQVMNNADYDWMMKTNDDIDIYQHHLRYIKTDLDNVFSRVATGRDFKNHFISKRLGECNEFIVPVEDVSSFSRLPFGAKWDKWQHVSPVKIWYHDSPEFTLNIMHDRVNFTEAAPTYCVILVDTLALCMKYYKWKRYGLNEEFRDKDTLTGQFFIHKHVICPMLYDLVDIWLLRQIVDMIDHSYDSEYVNRSYNDVVTNSQYGQVGLRYSDGMKSLSVELNNIKENRLYPNVFLNSPLLLNSSITDRCNESLYKWSLSGLRQFEYLDIMKDLELLKAVVGIHALNPQLNTYKRLMIEAKRQYFRLLNRRPWNRCMNSDLANTIEDKVLDYGRLHLGL